MGSSKKKPAAAAKRTKKNRPAAARTRALQTSALPPDDVTRDLFLVWRSPRVGLANPTRLTNPVWSWLARQRLDAYHANAHFAGPSSTEVGACFCVERYGQSTTTLPDGRVVAIGGEHEDYYDADFYIYNDVIVTEASGHLEIFGYPREAFPPTDFHTATLVGDRIVLIGALGYPAQRDPDTTPVFAVDATTFAITRPMTTGELPGWIYSHDAELAMDQRSITVRGGKRVTRVDGALFTRDNIDDWRLDLERLEWARLTERHWPTWDLVRADGKYNRLWEIKSMSWSVGRGSVFSREQFEQMHKRLGYVPDFEIFAARYSPPIAHTRIEPTDDGTNITGIVIDGVTVEYAEDMQFVRITVRGALPADTIAALVEDARRKVETLEQSPIKAAALP